MDVYFIANVCVHASHQVRSLEDTHKNAIHWHSGYLRRCALVKIISHRRYFHPFRRNIDWCKVYTNNVSILVQAHTYTHITSHHIYIVLQWSYDCIIFIVRNPTSSNAYRNFVHTILLYSVDDSANKFVVE